MKNSRCGGRRSTAELDRCLQLLADPHRRRILIALHRRPDGDELLVPEGVREEGDEFEALAVELSHNHLPKLTSSGYVRWDEKRQVVERGQRFDEIRPLLEALLDHADEIPGTWP